MSNLMWLVFSWLVVFIYYIFLINKIYCKFDGKLHLRNVFINKWLKIQGNVRFMTLYSKSFFFYWILSFFLIFIFKRLQILSYVFQYQKLNPDFFLHFSLKTHRITNVCVSYIVHFTLEWFFDISLKFD